MHRIIVAVFLIGVLPLIGGCMPEYSHLPMTPTQSIAQAEDALHRGEYETAIRGFSDYLATGEPTFRARAFFELAQAQYGLENYEATLDTLHDLDEQYPHQRWPQTATLRGDADYALGKREDAIREWDIAWQRGSDADRQFLRSRIERAIDELTPSQAGELATEVQNDDVRAMLISRTPRPSAAGRRAAGGAAPVGTRSRSSAAPAAPPVDAPSPAAEQAAAALETLPPADLSIGAGTALDSAARVAALLPLSGPDRTYGQRALSGLRLAFAEFPRMLVVRDTGGQSDLAAQLVTALAADPNVLAVVGPLRNQDASVVAPLAEREQIPLLLLARDATLTGPYVLQTSTTEQEQMQTLADYAVHTLGCTRLGVLYPDDAYGNRYFDAFRNQATQLGATVVKSSPYHPGQPNVSAQTALVKGWVSEDGVQAVFVPDAAPTAVKIAEAARAAAPDLKLLGTESWNQPDVLASAGKGIDGAVFADSFFIGAGMPSTADFVTRFRAQNGYSPTSFEAQAYDAGMLVREAIAGGARSRGAVLQFLRAVTNYRGAGSIASGANGLKPDLVLLQVQDGRVATITQQ
jgi:ABC-type branched-subunit amino acid transport system substrate-binding protein